MAVAVSLLQNHLSLFLSCAGDILEKAYTLLTQHSGPEGNQVRDKLQGTKEANIIQGNAILLPSCENGLSTQCTFHQRFGKLFLFVFIESLVEFLIPNRLFLL